MIGIGIVVGVAAALGTNAVVAGNGSPGPGQIPEPSELRKVEAEVVPSPSAGGVARATKSPKGVTVKPRRPQLVYLETAPRAVAPGATGVRIGDCPRRARAINGYYYLSGTQVGFGVDAQGDSPIRGLREWAFYLDGGDSGASNVTFGLVCLKNVK